MSLNVPTRHNEKLQQVVERINQDAELQQLWRCANINAVDRSSITDHGEVHIRIMVDALHYLFQFLVVTGRHF